MPALGGIRLDAHVIVYTSAALFLTGLGGTLLCRRVLAFAVSVFLMFAASCLDLLVFAHMWNGVFGVMLTVGLYAVLSLSTASLVLFALLVRTGRFPVSQETLHRLHL